MAGDFPHGFGYCSTCGRSGEFAGILDTMGVPQYRTNVSGIWDDVANKVSDKLGHKMGDTVDQVEKGIRDQAKRTSKKFGKGGLDKLTRVLDESRNALKSDISKGISEGVKGSKATADEVVDSALKKARPYLIGAGLLLAGLVTILVIKRKV